MASEFPEQRYLFVDGEVTGCDNVTSVLFKDNEKTYLVGTVAGLNTKTNKIGMVVGVDSPSQNIFVAGYMAGAKAANPDVEVIVKYVAPLPIPPLPRNWHWLRQTQAPTSFLPLPAVPDWACSTLHSREPLRPSAQM